MIRLRHTSELTFISKLSCITSYKDLVISQINGSFVLQFQFTNLSLVPSFLDKIVLINDPGYLPIDDDIIRVRRSTVGVIRK